MGEKLTLRLDVELIAKAKDYSRTHGKSVSRMVADYLSLLTEIEEDGIPADAPLTQSLHGALRGRDVSEEDYRAHLERKYLGSGNSEVR